jgi:hypothetical protein
LLLITMQGISMITIKDNKKRRRRKRRRRRRR